MPLIRNEKYPSYVRTRVEEITSDVAVKPSYPAIPVALAAGRLKPKTDARRDSAATQLFVGLPHGLGRAWWGVVV